MIRGNSPLAYTFVWFDSITNLNSSRTIHIYILSILRSAWIHLPVASNIQKAWPKIRLIRLYPGTSDKIWNSIKIRHEQATIWDLNLHRLYHSFKSSPVPAWQCGKTTMWPILKPSLFVLKYWRNLATCHYWAQLSFPATWGKIPERVYQSPNRRFHGSSCSRWSVQQPVVDHFETATVCK